MSIDVPTPDRIPLSQKERHVLKILHPVLTGQRTQAEAARLPERSVRQVRRLQRRLEAGADVALVHGLRGKPSNHQAPKKLKRGVHAAYRRRFADFGPTFASEKLAEEGLLVCPQTRRRWLLEAGLPSGRIWTCSNFGCSSTVGRWGCTPSGTASSKRGTKARPCPMR